MSTPAAGGSERRLLDAGMMRPGSSAAAPLSSESDRLREGERRQLVDWNRTEKQYPRAHSVHRLVEEQVERAPSADALVLAQERLTHGRLKLTYGQLNERANQLARYLIKRGVGPEVLVGLCVERSLEMVVGLLGILKAGGAYVPLDPAYPRQRLAFMLEDAAAKIVLTLGNLAPSLPGSGSERVCLDADWPAIALESVENVPELVTPDGLAYVIYTSGSTGTPKGVAVTHRSVLNLIWWHRESYAVTPSDRAAMLVSPAFDASVWEIWPYLAAGASLHIPDEETRIAPAKLSRWLESESISICFLPTPLAESVMAEPEPPRGSLRLMLTGGDQLHRRPDHSYGFRLFNHYGPTEATVITTAGPVATEGDREKLPSIGRPIANKRVYILDSNLQPVPIGSPGELHIAGEGLARGYLNRPELTAEKFIPDPFSGEPGARLYKSGDLARYREDGAIEYLGRIDDQVKIRGFRIEPGEIESAIVQHESVIECVVVAHEDVLGEKRLVAYLVTRGEKPPAVTELRELLKSTLPDYMIPSAFLFLDALPLTPNGKIDRRALPPPEEKRPDLAEAFADPRTPVEEILAGIWSQVLKIDRIGIHDNFFALGGHSVLGTQVLSRVREHFQVDLPLRALFERPTTESLAKLIGSARVDDPGVPPPPRLKQVSRDRELPLSFAQQRLWFLDQLELDMSSYIVADALRLRGDLDQAALRRALEELVRRHESLRTRFEGREGRAVQVVSEADFALAMEDVSGRGEGAEKEALVRVNEEVRKPFDLSRGPLFRASLLRLGPEDHIFLVVMHHIVCDGWSMGVFFRELEVLYGAFSRGEESPLPPLGLQYADYAVWERDWFQGSVLEKQLGYWTEQLRGAPAVLDLRGDRPRPAVRDFRGGRQRFFVPTSVSERITVLSRNEGVTLYMTLLAAFAVLLWRQTGQEEIVVGSPIFGRDRIETEGLIGFFINTIVLRTDLRGNPSFRELLSRVRETALGAYAHQDVPLEKVVDALKLERSLSHNPLFQVWFVLQNAGGPPPELAGLSVEEISLETQAIRHDLQLSISETPAGLAGEFEFATDIFDA
ncbi:MAG TPA: amino acid adenylation domain-containing protein, partial [Thermoanaerobaculia bacterium]